MKTAIILANGFEEVEATIPIDILRRGGVGLKILTLNENKLVTSSRGVVLLADDHMLNYKANDFDLIILPGGMPGASNLAASKELEEILFAMNDDKKIICAICAAPAIVIASKGLFKNNKYTCYPDFATKFSDGRFVNEAVVLSNNFITAQGAGVAFEFAFSILKLIKGEDVVQKIKRKVLL